MGRGRRFVLRPHTLAHPLIAPLLAAVVAVGIFVFSPPPVSASAVVPGRPVSSATVTTTAVRAVPQSFLGLSMNVEEMQDFTDNPAFSAIVQNLLNTQADGNGPFVLRLGGTYVDSSYWNGEESQVLPMYQSAPAFAFQRGSSWMSSLANFTRQTGSRVILNVNAVAHDAQMAVDFVRDAEQSLPAGSLMAVAIGNEPDNYNNPIIPVARNDAWSRGMTPATYAALFRTYARLLHANFPGLTLAGPESTGSRSSWTSTLLRRDAGEVGLVTSHVYPLNACTTPGGSQYPSLFKYLQSSLVQQTTQSLGYLLGLANNLNLPYRLTELGSGTCGGLDGVNNTFVTSLWAINQLFSFISAGLDGVNVHLRADAPNTAIAVDPNDCSCLDARPLLYGLVAFTDTLEPNDVLTQVSGSLQPNVSVWPLYGSDGWHLALVNTSSTSQLVNLSIPASGTMTLTSLSAPTPWSTQVTFGGQTITGKGTWSGPLDQTDVQPSGGVYPVVLPAASAVVADVAAAPGTTVAAAIRRHRRPATVRKHVVRHHARHRHPIVRHRHQTVSHSDSTATHRHPAARHRHPAANDRHPVTRRRRSADQHAHRLKRRVGGAVQARARRTQRAQIRNHLRRHPLTGQQRRHARRVAGNRLG